MAKKTKRATTRIAPVDDVARHLGRSHLETDPDTGVVIGVFNTSFLLKVKAAEKEASVNHLQYFAGDTLAQMKAIKADMVASGYTVGKQSAYAVVKVGLIEECGNRCDVALAAYKRPLDGNSSHAGVRGLPLDNANLDVLEELAKAASKLIFPAGDL